MSAPFDPPPGQAGPLSSAAIQLGQIAADLRKQQAATKSGGASALAQWKGKRSEDFEHAVGGLQVEVQLAATVVDAVATVLAGYARSLSSTTEDVSGYQKQFAKLASSSPNALPVGTQGPPAPSGAQILLEWDASGAKSALTRLAQKAAAEIDAQTSSIVPGSVALTPDQIRTKVDGQLGVPGRWTNGGMGPMDQDDAWGLLDSAQAAIPADDVENDGSIDWDRLYEQVRKYAVDVPVAAVSLGVAPSGVWAFTDLINAGREASDYVTGAKIASADIVAELARLSDSGALDGATASVVEYIAKGALALGYITGPGNKLTEAVSTASRGGLPETGAWGAFATITGYVSILGDVAIVLDPGDVGPDEAAVVRGTATANAAGTVAVLGGEGMATAVTGALGVNMAVDWVPVAGQAIAIGTGVFLAGDYLYHHWAPAKAAIDGTVHGIESGASAIGHFFAWAP